MSIQTISSLKIPCNLVAAFAAMSLIQKVSAENLPPCDPCKVEIVPAANAADIKHKVVRHQKDGIAGFAYVVKWSTTAVPMGAYLPFCANLNGQGLQPLNGWYVPTQMTRTYRLSLGRRIRAGSDFFEARYFNPCEFGPYKVGGVTEHNFWLVGDPANPNEREDKEEGDPPLPPIIVDPPNEDDNDEDTENPVPCPVPFEPGQFTPYRNTDTRTAVTLQEPTQVEFAAENINFYHEKNGFIQYNYNPETTPIPKYYLKEVATTVLTGVTPESPVGGSVTRLVHPMTGEMIEAAKTGNPSWFGPRAGPNVTLTETTASGSFDVQSYDDCPNEEDDAPGVMNFNSTLSDEYTKDRMLDDTFAHSWKFKGEGYYKISQIPSAALWVSDSQDSVTYWKTQYKIRVPADVPRPYKAFWVEQFTPDDPNPHDLHYPEKKYNFKSEEIHLAESRIHLIDPKSSPDEEGAWEVSLLPVDIKVHQDKPDPNGVPPKYDNAPKNYTASNLFVVWPDHEFTVKLKLPAPFDQQQNLSAGLIKWQVPGHSIPDNTLEAKDIKWALEDTYEIKITIGEHMHKVHVKVPDVGVLSQFEASSVLPNAAAALLYHRQAAIDYGNTHPISAQKDAMRHSYWCALSVSTGGVTASDVYFVTTAHEYENRYVGKQPAFNSTMDLKNNEVGMFTNHQVNGLPDEAAIQADLTQKYAAGEMYIWERPPGRDVGQEQSEGIIVKSNLTRVHP